MAEIFGGMLVFYRKEVQEMEFYFFLKPTCADRILLEAAQTAKSDETGDTGEALWKQTLEAQVKLVIPLEGTHFDFEKIIQFVLLVVINLFANNQAWRLTTQLRDEMF